MKKRLINLILVFLILVNILPNVSANTVGSGVCGDNLIWVLDDNGVLTISGTGDMYDYSYGSAPWAYCEFKSVVIGENVTSIGDYAFHSNLFDSIVMANSLENIGRFAFRGCENLSNITIPSSVINIEDGALNCVGINNIYVDKANNIYTSEGGVVFNKDKTTLIAYPPGKKDSTYIIPESVTSIGNWAFEGCTNLSCIIIPSSVTSIGEYVFSTQGGLNSIYVDDGNACYTSENGVLFNKDKTTLIQYPSAKTDTVYEIPNSVINIGTDAFFGCGLNSIVIPDSVISIGDCAFYSCNDLISITIPDSVTSIGMEALWNWNEDFKVYYNGTEEQWKQIQIHELNEYLDDTVQFILGTNEGLEANQIILTIGEKVAKVFGEAKENDVAPIIRNDRTMLPARFVAENLGAEVEWDGTARMVTVKNNSTEINIIIGSTIAFVNGQKHTLDSPAFIENDRTYTPVRFIVENLGAKVEWNESAQQVIITK